MTVLFPSTVAEACAFVADHSDAVVVGGGTDLFVHWPEQEHRTDRTYVDLSGVDELRTYRLGDSELTLGATTTYWDVVTDAAIAAEFPLLVEAARQVGAVQIQSRGTWAGNIVNASPAADGVPVLMAYGATVRLQSKDGEEEIALDDFYTGYKEMRRRPDQIITAITVPRRSYDFECFEKVGSRRAQTITKVGVAVTARGDDWRIVANSVGPTVCRCPALERWAKGGHVAASWKDVLAHVQKDVSPIDDVRSTARYREQVLARLLYHALVIPQQP